MAELDRIVGEKLADRISDDVLAQVLAYQVQVDAFIAEAKAWYQEATQFIEGQEALGKRGKFNSVNVANFVNSQYGPRTEDILTRGYALIEEMREVLTGEHITYQVGWIEDGTTLVEASLELEQILAGISASPLGKSSATSFVGLRLNKAAIISEARAWAQEQAIAVVVDDGSDHSSVFSTVLAWGREWANAGNTVNEGVLYEAYRDILSQRGGENKIPPPVEPSLMEQVYADARKNNDSWVLGGDIDTVQVKYFGGRPPSLTTMATVLNTLIQVQATLHLQTKGQMEQILLGIFTKDNKMSTAAINKALGLGRSAIKTAFANKG